MHRLHDCTMAKRQLPGTGLIMTGQCVHFFQNSKDFDTPHTGEAECQFLYEVIKDLGLCNSLMAVKTDKESDMISGVGKLNAKIRDEVDDQDP